MAINLLSVTVKHERRMRLLFDNTLAAGAFGTGVTTLGLYSVQNTDGFGPSANVVAALLVPGSPNVVELALGTDLAIGSLYSLSAVGVPCTDATVTSALSVMPLRWGANPVRANQELPEDDFAALLYGTDFIHTGVDYLETADNDLAVVSGLPCVEGDLRRGALANGCAWKPDWGGKLRYFVDGVTGALPNARAFLSRFFLADDRVKACSVVLNPGLDPTQAYFDCSVTLVGSELLTAFSVQIPNT